MLHLVVLEEYRQCLALFESKSLSNDLNELLEREVIWNEVPVKLLVHKCYFCCSRSGSFCSDEALSIITGIRSLNFSKNFWDSLTLLSTYSINR